MGTQKQPSLQSILKRRQQEAFIGREEQITLFRQNLTYALDDERRRFIFNVFGQGGVGKTTLLRLFSKLATDANAKVAWIDETIENMPTAMAHIAKQLEEHNHVFNIFNERYNIYRQRLHELEADPEAPQDSIAFASHFLTKVGVQLGRRIPVAGAVLDLVDENALASQVSEWSEYVKRKLTNKDELHLIQNPLDVLTPLFLDGLGKAAEKHCIALFLDTYEYTGEYLDTWLRKLLDGFYGDVPSNIILIIAGRHELDRNYWIIYEGLLVRFELEPFTEQEAREYLARKGIVEERTVEIILHLSGGFPLLVATLASESPTSPDQVGDPSGTAIERFLKWENDPKHRQMLIDAALPRFLNRDILAALMGDEYADSFFAWLKQKPFIEQRGKGWVYHEIVRSQMLRYKLRESPQGWSVLHGQLADYYEQLCNYSNLSNEMEQNYGSLNSLLLEACYHRICQSPQKGILASIGPFSLLIPNPGNTQDSMSLGFTVMIQALKDCDTEEKEAVSQLEENLKEATQAIEILDLSIKELFDYVKKLELSDDIQNMRKHLEDLALVRNRIISFSQMLGIEKVPIGQRIRLATEELITKAEKLSNLEAKPDSKTDNHKRF